MSSQNCKEGIAESERSSKKASSPNMSHKRCIFFSCLGQPQRDEIRLLVNSAENFHTDQSVQNILNKW